ncbi:MFS transporter [Rothia sp. CCM 9418]|uniref:MFS transporter n=1 Tax=Rothia sp. CCM 9418 TaxID=3402661 RepID=UPI003AE4DA33
MAVICKSSKFLEYRILSALMLSEASEGIRTIASPFLVYTATGRLSSASLVAVSGAIPAILVGILGSPQVEKLNRQKIIAYSNILQSILLITLPLTWASAGIFAMMVISFISSSVGALERPAMYSSLPLIFGENYQDFIGKRAGVSFFMQSVSPVMGGALVGFIGASHTLVICGILYGVYALLIYTIKNFDTDYKNRAKKHQGQKNIDMVKAGIEIVRNIPALKTLYIFWFFSMTAVPIGVLSAVPYVSENLGLTSFEFGIASACYGVATISSSIIAGKMKFRGGARSWLLASGTIYGLTNMLMGFEPQFLMFCILWFIWGLAYGPEEVVGNLVFVQSAPEEFQGRLFSLMTVVMTGGMLIGNSLVGPLSDRLGPQWAMVLAGVIFITSTICSFAFGQGAREIATISMTSTKPTSDEVR